MTRLTRRTPIGSEGARTMGWLGRIARLDFTVFDELRSDRSATPVAVVIVLAASVLAGIGTLLWALQHENFGGHHNVDVMEVFLKAVIIGSIVQTGVWFAWVYITYMLAARIFGSAVHFGELTRVMGFAFAPVALSLLIAIAPLAVPFGLLAFGITLMLMTAAVERAAEIEPRQAMLSTLGGFAVFLTFMGAFANVMEVATFGGLAPGILFFSLDF
ncbi:MAG: YIP1 family protein [Chloroflexi bacterium]|nr:YIP1 family protein [Chloroflexota bacterium]MCI0818736.1 YIP1 family protein [Chloroflexota bacterium]MCI0832259.1 YIP1 family protein [Chloroflexota bacterium]MCI0839420.1 YIP1 family protein [Chloroflexota bacterium]